MTSDISQMIIAIPSDGALYESTLKFLDVCGLRVNRENSRRYTATIPVMGGVSILFQRGADITGKVEDANADVGILGYDRFLEIRREDGSTKLLIENLGFGSCLLAIGVPDSWIDVSSFADLADVSAEFRAKGETIRIATKFPRLVEIFLLKNGVSHFSLVESSGTLEVAPEMGFADIIVDITATGTTMRENNLKLIHGGTVIESEACLIGNSESLLRPGIQKLADDFVSKINKYMDSRQYKK